MKPLPQIISCSLVLGTAVAASAKPKNVASLAPAYERSASRDASAPAPAVSPSERDVAVKPKSPAGHVHVRHGLYLRGALGGSFVLDSVTASDGSSLKLHGAGLAADVLLGGSIIPGLAVGGGVTVATAEKPTASYDGASFQVPATLNFKMVSAFADWYPMPSQGLHFLGMCGFAGASLSDPSGHDVTTTASGPAFAVGAGYEWSLGKKFGLGVMARYVFASLQDTSDGVTEHESVSAPDLVMTASYY